DVNAVLGEFITVVGEVVAKGKDKLTIPGFISFEQTERKARMGRNPQTGEQIQVPATKAVKISAGSKLKKIAKGEETP
ncbi:MAG: HU family DNA-binding protein, partial [Candidatus Microthrix subdominans]